MRKSILYLMMSRDSSEPLAKKLVIDIQTFLKSLGDTDELTLEAQWKLVCLIYKGELEDEDNELSLGVGALKQFITKNLEADDVALTETLDSEKSLDQLSPEVQKNIEKFLLTITHEIDHAFFSNITKIYWNRGVSFESRLNVLLHLLYLRTSTDNFYKNERLPEIEFAITEMFSELLPSTYVKSDKHLRAFIKGIKFILNKITHEIPGNDKLIAYFDLLLKNIKELDNLKLNYIIDTTIVGKKTREQIIGILKEHDLLTKFIDQLPTLSHSDEERVLTTLTNLKNNNLLDKESFALALQRITSRLPYVESDKVKIELLEKDNLHFKLENLANHAVFFVSDPNDRGRFGTISKGYLTHDLREEPVITVKEHLGLTYGNFFKKYSREYEKVDYQEQAIREIKYQRFFGNKDTFYFFKNKKSDSYSLVYPWKTGKPMPEYSFDNHTLNTRLQFFASLLDQLDYLHHNYRIHGDIRLDNVIVDKKNLKLHLIDFGTARKNASKKSFGGRGGIHANTFKGDMLGLLDIVEKIFSMPDSSASSQLVKENDASLQDNLINLVHEQIKSAINQGCSSERVLNYCQTLLSQPHLLDEDSIKETAEKILLTKTNSVEDVLRM